MHKLKRFALKRKVLFIRSAAILVPILAALVLLSQTAFAKNTYVITDGDRIFTYTTFATDPAAVLGEAGLELGENDTYTTQAADGQAQITVRRSQTVTVIHRGEVMQISSKGETVGDLLTRLNITLDSQDTLSHPVSAETFDGMELRIDCVLQQEETYTSNIPYGTTEYYDPTLPEGVREVLVEGVDGQVRCTATVTYVNGTETKRVVLTQQMISHAVDEVVAIGSGQPADTAPGGEPIIGENTITLPTGEVLTFTHTTQVRATAYYHGDPGCDMITATGTTVHLGTVAVDPRFIPYGTRMFIVSNDGVYVYGVAVAEDCGGAIKGDRVDLYLPTNEECIQFGKRTCTVYFLGS